MKIIVLGYIVRGPLGGLVWHHLQYVLGLHKMGHDVLFLEDSENYESCYDPSINTMTTNPKYGLNFIKKTFKRFGLDDNWAYFDEHKQQWFGKNKENVMSFCQSAEVVLNLSGVNPLRDWFMSIPKRVFIDTDPAFVQIRHLTNPSAKKLAELHTSFFSFGENIGKTDCLIPDDGFKWLPTRQPVVMDIWKTKKGNQKANWTTVMQWDSYKSEVYDNRIFGMKSLSFEDYFDLPSLTEGPFELAIGSNTVPKVKLHEFGWKSISSLFVTKTPWAYQKFILESKGEWSIAKHGYVVSNSGWFSERSAGYLASGRPVVVQDTGFSQILPTGRGLFAFKSKQEAIDSFKIINSQYQTHCEAAREIATQYFDAPLVLKNLLNKI